MILFDETIRQSTSDGVPMPDLLATRGLIPGIKVDTDTSTTVKGLYACGDVACVPNPEP